MSRSGTTLFASMDAKTIPVKDFYINDKDVVLKILTEVALAYEKLCVNHKPGKSGIARKKDYDLVIENLRKENNPLAPAALIELCRFYEKHHNCGRLSDGVETALMKILKVTPSLDLKCEDVVPVVTSANILSLACFWHDQSRQMYAKLDDAITRIKQAAGVAGERKLVACVIL
jgi:hypothetical protein